MRKFESQQNGYSDGQARPSATGIPHPRASADH
jgi:hypothetical protein